MAKQAKETLAVEEIKALADKGYYSSKDLKECVEQRMCKTKNVQNKECAKQRIQTFVPKPENVGYIENPAFRSDKFHYDKENNCYICPAGQTLYFCRIREVKDVQYQLYKTIVLVDNAG